MRLDQETVSALLKSMDKEYDRSILRAIIALLHTRSDPTLVRRKIKEVIEVAVECRMSIVAGKDIVNLRLKVPISSKFLFSHLILRFMQ